MFSRPVVSPLALAVAATAVGSPLSDAATESPRAGSRPIEEVTVTGNYTTNDRLDTATGLGLTLQETPQSVSVMTYQRIADQDLRTLTDVVRNAPGVSAKGLDSSRQSYSARGFSIDNYQIDGVPMTWSSGGDAGETQSHTALYERIEVVRGSTGLLTGAGNPSASINLVRKHADHESLTGNLSVSAGRWDNYAATADVGSALNSSGTVRGRAVMVYEDGDSFRDLAGDTTKVLYGVVDADLTDRTLLRIGASYQDNDPKGSTWGGLPVWFSDGSRTDWNRSKTIGTHWTSWASTVQNQFVDLIHEFGDGWTAKFNVNRNLNEADLMLLYLSGQVDPNTGLGLGASPRNSETERDQISYSFQINGTYSLFGRQHDLTIGAIQMDQDFESAARERINTPAVGNFFQWDGSYSLPTWGAFSTDVDMETEQSGVYAATRLSVSDALKVILGGRVADWEQEGTRYGSGVDYGDTGVVVPYFGALYDITSDHTVYTSYTEIFLPQNSQDISGRYLDPVTGESYELGLKSRFFNDALHTTFAVFQVEQDGLAQAVPGAIVPGSQNAQAYRAADGAESEGFEIEVVGQITESWDVSFSYTEFDIEDADGNEVNTDQPHELLKLYTTYRFTGELDRLTLAGGVTWEGSNYTATTNPITGEAEKLEQEDFALVSLMARYALTPDLTAQLNIDNALDEEYYSQIGFYNQLEFGQPRDVTLSLRYQF